MYQLLRINADKSLTPVGPPCSTKKEIWSGAADIGVRKTAGDFGVGPDNSPVVIGDSKDRLNPSPRQNPAITFDIDNEIAHLLFRGAANTDQSRRLTEMLLTHPYMRERAALWAEHAYRTFHYVMTSPDLGGPPSRKTLDRYAEVITSVIAPLQRAGVIGDGSGIGSADLPSLNDWLQLLRVGVTRNTKLREHERKEIMQRAQGWTNFPRQNPAVTFDYTAGDASRYYHAAALLSPSPHGGAREMSVGGERLVHAAMADKFMRAQARPWVDQAYAIFTRMATRPASWDRLHDYAEMILRVIRPMAFAGVISQDERTQWVTKLWEWAKASNLSELDIEDLMEAAGVEVRR